MRMSRVLAEMVEGHAVGRRSRRARQSPSFSVAGEEMESSCLAARVERGVWYSRPVCFREENLLLDDTGIGAKARMFREEDARFSKWSAREGWFVKTRLLDELWH